MNDKLRIEILEFLMNNPEKMSYSELPKELKDKITEEDFNFLLTELPSGNIDTDGISQYLTQIQNRFSQNEILKIQKNTTKTQWIIVSVMITTVLIGFFTAYLNWRSYEMNFELTNPKFKLTLDCSPISVNNSINLTPEITNYGEIGDFIHGEMSYEGDIILTDLTIEGIPYQNYNSTKPVIFTDKFIEKNKPNEYPVSIDLYSTKDFTVNFKFWCKDTYRPCKFLNSNEMSCQYKFNGTHYIYQQTCIVQ